MSSQNSQNNPADFIAREEKFGAQNYSPLPVVITRGRGVWLWDIKGDKYLDMMSTYSAISHGHLHPRLVDALKRQLDDVAVVSRAFYSDQLGYLEETLCNITGLDACLPMNSGAEAVETAIKAARRWGVDKKGVEDGKQKIIVADRNFHGRTVTIIGFSSEPSYRRGFGPFDNGFASVPFGDAAAMEAAITPDTVAIMVEPIQGEAGINVPPEGYLKALRDIATKHNVLLMFDEIQSGLGRTGKMFCYEHEDARPDGLILGKALGGGLLPISAFISTREVMDVFVPGSHGSTFGGNPLACAVAHEAIKVLQDEKLVERSAEMGRLLKGKLAQIEHKAIIDIRGRGLWVGVEIDPAFAHGHDVCLEMMKRGVLAKETHGTVIRFAPPLVIEEAEIDMAVNAFKEALHALEK